MPVRVGPKSRKSAKKGWPSKTRSYPWRKGTSRPAEALMRVTRGVSKAATVHRFTRQGAGLTLQNYDAGGGVNGFRVITDDAGAATPLTIGSVGVDGASNFAWQMGGAFMFTLADVCNATDFTALFDHYEIEQVDIEFDCNHNVATNPTGQSSMPTINYVPDFDDSALPTIAKDISQYQRAKQWTFRGSGKPLKVSIKPRVAVPIYTESGPAAYGTGVSGMKLNLEAPQIPHYGMKFWLSGMSVDPTVTGLDRTGQCSIRIKCTYHLRFLDPK